MKKSILLAGVVLAVILTLSSCKKSNQVVRLSGFETELSSNGTLLSRMAQEIVWYRGEMRNLLDTVTSYVGNPSGTTITTIEDLIYEGHNVTTCFDRAGKWKIFYTYENDRLQSFVDYQQGDTLYYGNIIGYDANGNVAEYVLHSGNRTYKYQYTWENGDAVKMIQYTLSPAEAIDTAVYTFAYDNKPSCYTGFPLAKSVEDGYKVALYQSKHNLVDDAYTYEYDGDKLITKTKKDGSLVTRFSYILQDVD